MKIKNTYSRYVVEAGNGRFVHSYSTQLGNQKALDFAITCADHFSTRGKVYGEDSSRNKTLLYDSELNN